MFSSKLTNYHWLVRAYAKSIKNCHVTQKFPSYSHIRYVLTFEYVMLDGSNQRRNSTSRQSFSSPSSLNSLRVSGRSRRRNDDSIRSYDYQRDPTLDQDPQVDGDVETVTEPLEMYEGGSGGSRRRTNTSLAPTTQQVIKLVPNQGYNDHQNDCAPSYAPTALSFPSILCIPCPCVSGPSAQNCPPTCVTYHPVDPSAAQTLPQPSNTQAVTPHLPPPTSLPIPASSMVPQTQVNHIYTYGNGAQFERDHHFPPAMPAACCGGQLQLQQRAPPPPPQPCYDSQPSCPFNPNNSFSSTSYFHESPQSTCGGGGNQGCCPSTSNDYRYFAPRRRRRCRREYYLQITKGKCRTGFPDDSSEDTDRSITTGGPSRTAGAPTRTGATMPATRPTHFPINFRLQKASMNEPITRPALPPTRPALTMGRPAAMPTMRPALPSTSFSSKSSNSSSSKNSSMNDSVGSMSSVATNRSASSPNSPQKTPDSGAGSNASAPSEQNSEKNQPLKKIPAPALKIPTANDGKNGQMEKPEPVVDKPATHVGRSNGNAGKTNGRDHMSKPNGHVGKKLVFNTQGHKKNNSSNEERGRFGSVPLIQETAASVLRKRHNEIRMQAIREMLEKDMRRLKQA